MCAIAGILNTSTSRPIDPDRVMRMRDRMAHRGPDGAGVVSDGHVGLAHRRLAIVDESGGHQPMSTPDARVWVVFNGEIYNHEELRQELVAGGASYRTRSDTETILHAWVAWREACVARLEGMFAFAIWDRTTSTFFLARDRCGIKPLFITQAGDELLFASEVRALIEAGTPARVDRLGLHEFLASRHAAGSRTCYRDVARLPPGHTLRWSPGNPIAIEPYWRLPAVERTSRPDFDEAVVRVRRGLIQAVERHLMSDRPVGVLLSGGLDSSALAAIAARQMRTRLQTFSVGFHEREGDELAYAREVAESIGSEHRDVRLTGDEFFAALPRLIASHGEPLAFASAVPLHAVCQLARPHVKVVLTGEGADELFLGYNRYRVTFWNDRLGRPYDTWVPSSLRAWVRRAIRHLPPGVRRYAARTGLAVPAGPRARFFDNFSVFSDERLDALLTLRSRTGRDPYAYGLRCYLGAVGGPLERMAAADVQTYLCELLAKQDRMSMAASIESRVPFLDDRMVALACALPGAFKIRGFTTKAVLRAAVRELLPPRILSRRKMGFPVPLARWFRGPYRAVVQEFVLSDRAAARDVFNADALRDLVREHHAGVVDHSERLWLLINIEMWQRLMVDGDAPDDIMRPTRGRAGDPREDSLAQTRRALAG